MRVEIYKVALIASFLVSAGAVFATDVGGLICTDTTWDLAGSPYHVTGGTVIVGCDATLTIEAGVEVKFEAKMAIVVGYVSWGGGTLVARGTHASPIIFTSVKEPASAGDWSRIHFTDYATDALADPCDPNVYLSGSILEYVIVEYAGHGNYGAIFAEKSSPLLNRCEVRHNSYYGIEIDGTNAPGMNIANCEVWDHPQHGIYISNGSTHRLADNNIYDSREGGIYFSHSTTNTLTGNTISGNTTGRHGGGIHFHSGSGGNTLTGNTITGNTGAQDGGGISFDSSGGNTLTGNTITGNIAYNGSGGGISFDSSRGNTLTGNTISGNTASINGGGIGFGYGGGNTLTGNTITGNIAYNGGGIIFSISETSSLTGNTISGNTAADCGGGIMFWTSGSNTLTGNTISGNTADDTGGGIYFIWSGSNTLTGNDINGNRSVNGAGAIYIVISDNNTLSGNTITNNQTDTGTTGGIYVSGCEWLSLAGDPCEAIYNVIRGNDGYQLYNNNAFNAEDERNDVSAGYVQWGACDGQDIMDGIFDYFDDASKAFVVFYPFVRPGDFDTDGELDFADLAAFIDNWLRSDCGIPDWCGGADLDLSTTVDFFDYADSAKCWPGG